MNRVMGQLKVVISFVLLALLATLAFQNTAEVQLTFLHWSFQSRRIVVIGISLLTGLIIGWLFGRFRR